MKTMRAIIKMAAPTHNIHSVHPGLNINANVTGKSAIPVNPWQIPKERTHNRVLSRSENIHPVMLYASSKNKKSVPVHSIHISNMRPGGIFAVSEK